MFDLPGSSHHIETLLSIMARLRDPIRGCPWNLKQDFATIAPYVIEEAYEVVDAIDRSDLTALKDELGDLLLQIVFHAHMAAEQGAFEFSDVIAAITNKMVRRHPHVFGEVTVDDAQAVSTNWEAIKRQEREAVGERDDSALAGISRGLPEWLRTLKLQERTTRAGFKGSGPIPAIVKVQETLEHIHQTFLLDTMKDSDEQIEETFGNLLFLCISLAHHAKVDPGNALRRTNLKFEGHFRAMETAASAAGTTLEHMPLSEQEILWKAVKRQEVDPSAP
ncbi:nucleoside triphosphate pyrophosphohydrolase [Xylella taiwanensis]|uniref:Nucleoside triphosphate pyrophosphohydrolase n=1 Tax=Xylella taiwanensis TaxID=1444770 RepID=Z9JJA2_9GAMM|nr:nucleoside triphosphate pyrophosphohydrolase [Xylella taiwanensis]AXI82622.1 nucleoside triphosphate hydrolase [Xylella taiwanensis]EWS78269.1 nucleoside triphosphate pyrophosphohydrolase [Xylella taiwanensis]MCD8455617.1 nucleoside triphosphate pyrophosphohydrolase [Xylella taiwanensis]MCD8458024.1 nucleoside triphosphate pyrophosphohydrolase [Xylella taiwanensis]MCD8460160.1 nucleoside triphosphate pyrophosphohydrolase [Xylella taiwanensis]